MLNVSKAGAPPIDQLFPAAMAHHQAGRLAEAEQLYRQILAQNPRHADAIHLLGVLACQVGQNDRAIVLIDQAIAIDSKVAAYHSNLGEALRKAGQTQRAEQELRQALQLDPAFVDAGANLGLLLLQSGRNDESIAVLQRVATLAPQAARPYRLMGDALAQLRRWPEAIEAYHRSLQLEPRQPDLHFNLGVMLGDLGRAEEAAGAFRAVLVEKPTDIEARLQLSEMYVRTSKLNEAMTELQRVVALDPAHADAFSRMGNLLRTADRVDDAIAAYQQAVRLKPDEPVIAANMAFAFRDQARLGESIAVLRKLLDKNPMMTAVRSGLIFTMHLVPALSRQDIVAEQATWNRLYIEPHIGRRLPDSNHKIPNRRIRIGYLSPDFRSHPVGRFMLPLVKNHSREQVRIYCYYDRATPDSYTKAIEAVSDDWRQVNGMDDQALAEQIRADKIDVLVDLCNHTIGNRMPLFGTKPAPIQITYLAYCAGTGLCTMDYRLTDPLIDPPSAAADAVPFEKPLRLAETYWCYAPHEDAGPVTPLPRLARGHVTFGAFNYFSKCNDLVLALWARLLAEMPEATFMLHVPAGSREAYVRQFFETRGIAPGRLELVPRTAEKTYFTRYQQVDICLDTFPWAGGTTTCDALWMGVPVITLASENTISRGGLSILTNLGFPEWIAHTPDEYIAKARAAAADVDRLRELRGTLRERMRASVLMDAGRFAGNVEKAYHKTWQAWCAAV